MLKSCISAFVICFSYATVFAQAADTLRPLLFIENLDNFPANDRFVFSRLEIPASRDTMTYNANHDSLTLRIRNKGTKTLVISNLHLANDTAWRFVKLRGVDYDSATALPLNIGVGTSADLTVKFVASNVGKRVKILYDTLSITSNDSKIPKSVYLSGLWQRKGESNNEPYLQEIINAFGFKTKTGFSHTDPDKGDSTKLKGNQIRSSFFVRADTLRPVTIRQMSAYHACCTATEKITWYVKGTNVQKDIFTHLGVDAQSVLPRKGLPNSAAAGVINPTTPFGLKIGYTDNTDASKNPAGKLGIRVLRAYDAYGHIIPNSYIISNDYLGTSVTNYDYNDNTYFVTNVQPESGAAGYSILNPTPSDIDFGEKILNTSSSFSLKLSSLGKIYPDSSKDPVIKIDSVRITGENKSEFSYTKPVKSTLNPQDSTTLTVNFAPITQGLKISDLLIYYNNALSPLRVPVYGIARSSDTMVVVNYRINSGSARPITINGKTWAADNQYAFDNIEPYTNPLLHSIAGTDEDSLYLKEQSSNADKKPFRYEFPVDTGTYVVRLHFAEIYWAAPGSGVSGGAGSRIMNISLENQPRLVNFDVTQEAGRGATALVKNLPVTVTDGKLNINFTASVNRPMVVAVEVLSFRASTILSSADPIVNVLPGENKLKKPKVYPNPLQKTFNIVFPSEYSGFSVLQISDALGHKYDLGKVKLQRGGTNSTQVDISGLALKPGFYYLRIVSEKRSDDVIKLIVR